MQLRNKPGVFYPASVDEKPAPDARNPNVKQAHGDKKVPLHLVPPSAMIYIALALREGNDRYDAWNWRESKIEAMTYIGAALRHIMDFVDGVDIDPDSKVGKPSLAGAMASLAILVDAIENDSLIDNRPPKGNVAEMFKKWKLD